MADPDNASRLQRALELYLAWQTKEPAEPFEEFLARNAAHRDLLEAFGSRAPPEVRAAPEPEPALPAPAIDDGVKSVALADASALRVQRIGPYQIRKTLGQGGVATVYLADQSEPVNRRVALKVLHAAGVSDDRLQRFQAEMQTLAFLNHHNIAKVFDAGSTPDGLVYCALEFVQGAPVTEHCDAHELGIRKRLELFDQICNAVQYMHGKGIIHRDLKPSNVLVSKTSGADVVKVIDFGIAKITDESSSFRGGLTEQGAVLGTPMYMSPEQARGSGAAIDVRTDVYALGMILYELIAGALPYDRPRTEEDVRYFLSQIGSEDPPRPSTRFLKLGARAGKAAQLRGVTQSGLLKLIRADLDWIVTKAIARDKEERYASVAALTQDVESYLHDEPVQARPPSISYRVRKLARRHKAAVATMFAMAFALLLGISVSSWWYLSAARSRSARDAIVAELNDVRMSIANAHLWFEEAVSGDASIRVEIDVFRRIAEATTRIRGTLEAAPASGDLGPRLGSKCVADLARLGEEIDRFGATARRRWEVGQSGGETGSRLDQEFDENYRRIEALCAGLDREFDSAALEGWSRLAQLSIGINFGAAILLIGFLLYWFRAGRTPPSPPAARAPP